MTSISSGGSGGLVVKFVKEGNPALDHQENYRELAISTVAWGRVFVTKDQIEHFGGIDTITNLVNQFLRHTPVSENSLEITLFFDGNDVSLDQEARSSSGAGSSSSGLRDEVSSTVSSKPKSDRVSSVTGLINEKKVQVLSEFNEPKNARYPKRMVQKTLDELDNFDLVLENVDELVARIKKLLLVPDLVFHLQKQNPDVDPELLTKFVTYALLNTVKIDLNMKTDSNTTPESIQNHNKKIDRELVKTITKQIHSLEEAVLKDLEDRDFGKADQLPPTDDLLFLLRVKRKCLVESMPELRSLYPGLNKFVINVMNDQDIIKMSITELQNTVKQKIDELPDKLSDPILNSKGDDSNPRAQRSSSSSTKSASAPKKLGATSASAAKKNRPVELQKLIDNKKLMVVNNIRAGRNKAQINEQALDVLNHLSNETLILESVGELTKRVIKSIYILDQFKLPNNKLFSQEGVKKVLAGLDIDALVETEVIRKNPEDPMVYNDQLMNLIKVLMLAPKLAAKLKEADTTYDMQTATAYITYIMLRLPNINLNISRREVYTETQIKSIYAKLMKNIENQVWEAIETMSDAEFDKMEKLAFDDVLKVPQFQDPVKILENKRNTLLQIFDEQSSKKSNSRYQEFKEHRESIVNKISDRNLIVASIDELRTVINESIRDIRKKEGKHLVFNDEVDEKKLKSIPKPTMRILAELSQTDMAEQKHFQEAFWTASRKLFSELLGMLARSRQNLAASNTLASYLEDLLATLPNDKIKSQRDH